MRFLVIQSAGVDIFRDNSFAYADRLKADGVDVESFLRCYSLIILKKLYFIVINLIYIKS